MAEDARTPGGAVLMDGKKLRDEIVVRIRGEIEAAGSPQVCLATVLVGTDKPSQIYVRNKHRKAEDRRETVQEYINREYRRAPRPRIKGAQWAVIVEGGTTKALLANYARAFDAEQRLVSGDVDGAVDR